MLLLGGIVLSVMAASSPFAQEAAPIALQPDFGNPLPGLTFQQLERFKQGKDVFDKMFTAEEGLGPVMNEFSCGSCHGGPISGGSHSRGTVDVVRRFGHLSGQSFDPLSGQGGSLKQNLNINSTFPAPDPCKEVIPDDANIVAVRNTTIVFGDGLIEYIPDGDILANTANGGQAHLVTPRENPNGPQRVGRFGWKAQVATTLSFAADALNNEMGITNALFPDDPYPNALDGTIGPCTDAVADPEDQPDENGITLIEKLRDFMVYLAPPAQMPRSGMRGEQTFKDIGCAVCHVPSFSTPEIPGEPALSNKEVKVYSDFLLHDMGELGDGIEQGQARPREMRTAMLWGLNQRRGFHDLLHDSSILEQFPQSHIFERVIAAHGLPGSEAAASSAAYFALSMEDQSDLLNFLESLGRREFNLWPLQSRADQNNFEEFKLCYQQPGHNYTPDDSCAMHDINQDSRVDHTDLDSFLTVYTMPIDDCQCDGEADILQILDDGATLSECRRYMTLSLNGQLDIEHSRLEVRMDVNNLKRSEPLSIYYSWTGQGTGPSFGEAVCINLDAPGQVTEYTRTNESVFDNATIVFSLPILPGAREASFQVGVRDENASAKKSNVVTMPLVPGADSPFIRGDANRDNRVDISDPVFLLTALFLDGPYPVCWDAADANDDGFLDLSDAIKSLQVLFTGHTMPPPYPDPGSDPSADHLPCVSP